MSKIKHVKPKLLLIALFSILVSIALPAYAVVVEDGNLNIQNDFTVDTDTLYIDSTNNLVGIGNIAPQYTLDVEGTIAATSVLSNGVAVITENTYPNLDTDATDDLSLENFPNLDTDNTNDIISVEASGVLSSSGGTTPTISLNDDSIDGDNLADTITLDADLIINEFDVILQRDLNVGFDIEADESIRAGSAVKAPEFCLDGTCITSWPTGEGGVIVDSLWTESDDNIYVLEKSVGIGTDSPQHELHVQKDTRNKIVWAGIQNLNYGGGAGLRIGYGRNFDSGTNLQHVSNTFTIDNRGDPRSTITFKTRPASGKSLERMRIDQDGNIGIGTEEPSQKLDVIGKVKAEQFCIEDNCISSWNEQEGGGGGTGDSPWSEQDDNIYVLEKNVGIGTDSPQHEFHVQKSNGNKVVWGGIQNLNYGGGAGLRIGYGRNFDSGTNLQHVSNTFTIDNRGDPRSTITFKTRPASGKSLERMRIDQDGNIGIGTDDPQSRLHVAQGYIQLDLSSGEPPEVDCNSDDQKGRMILDTDANKMWVCNGEDRGWDSIDLAD